MKYLENHDPIISSDVLKQLLDETTEGFKTLEKMEQVNETQSYIQKEIVANSDNEFAIIGDIHGSAHSLLKILTDLKNKKYLQDNFKIIKDNFYIVFAGDYVDRGFYGTEVWYALMKLKLANWNKVFLLRGNHEDYSQNMVSKLGFFSVEANKKYNKSSEDVSPDLEGIKLKFIELYKYLSIGLYIGVHGDGKDVNWIQFCHGGIGNKEVNAEYTISEILNTFLGDLDSNICIVPLPSDDHGLGYFYLWGDFIKNENKKISCKDRNEQSGINPVVWENVRAFLESNNIRAIFRGHQHLGAGLKMFAEDSINPGDPISWKSIVNKEEMDDKSFLIHKYFPVFTFTTATEFGLSPEVFYGILRTNAHFNEWTLNPVVVEDFALQPEEAAPPVAATTTTTTTSPRKHRPLPTPPRKHRPLPTPPRKHRPLPTPPPKKPIISKTTQVVEQRPEVTDQTQIIKPSDMPRPKRSLPLPKVTGQ